MIGAAGGSCVSRLPNNRTNNQMAYLDPQSITCKTCGHAGELTWIVGIGPHTKPDEGASYYSIQKAGPWIIKTSGKTTQVFCPTCAEMVTERAP